MEYKRILARSIPPHYTLLEALKQMDSLGVKSLIVLDGVFLNGVLSIGDIQRAIIGNTPLDRAIDGILRKNPRVGNVDMSNEEVKETMLKYKMEFLPIVNDRHEISGCFFWEDLFPHSVSMPHGFFDLPVVIMAGGLGTRLKPLTNVLPKPLLPIDHKTMLEEIFDRFSLFGCNRFYISVNHKADLIEYYISQLNLPYHIKFFRESKPLGTAGSLHLLNGLIDSTFIVTNCDILIEQDYSEIVDYHRNNNNEITIVSALRHYPIPYGTIETGLNGQLNQLIEKPELTFKINSGMYILEPGLLDEIPENEFFHFTHLIEKVMERKGKVGVFPVSEGSWKDIGTLEEYLKLLVR